uniref:Uncharacterized protein n=1 Tax=Spermophilus dauricus TaxID=99837 RepID=A0A8C9P760_SPEDA
VGQQQDAGGDVQLRDSFDGPQQERGGAQEAPHHPDERTGGLGLPASPPPPAGHGVHQHLVAVLADGHHQEDADEQVGLDNPADHAAEEGPEGPVELAPDVLGPEGQAQDEHQVGSRQVGEVDFRCVQSLARQEEDGQDEKVPQEAQGADGKEEGGQHPVQQGPGLGGAVAGGGVGRGLQAAVGGLELQEDLGCHPR